MLRVFLIMQGISLQILYIISRWHYIAHTRRAMQAIGIQQCIPLPFQYAGSKSLLPKPPRNQNGSIVQPHIRLLQHQALQHPLQKQALAHPYFSRWQLLDAIKENAHQTLLLGDTISFLPIRLFQGRRNLRLRADADSWKI